MSAIQMGDNKNPVAAATVVAVGTGTGAPMDVAAFTNLANGTSCQIGRGLNHTATQLTFFFSLVVQSTTLNSNKAMSLWRRSRGVVLQTVT